MNKDENALWSIFGYLLSGLLVWGGVGWALDHFLGTSFFLLIGLVVGAGAAQGAMDASNMLKPALANGSLKVIASTTWEEYTQSFEKDRALMRRFQRITVDEPTQEVTLQILKGIKKYYEGFHNVKIKDDALQSAIKLSVKYQSDKKLPDKAIDLIDLACSRFNLKLSEERTVTEREIQYELSKVVQMPEEVVAETESQNLSSLQTKIEEDVFGQNIAVTEVVDNGAFQVRA